MPLVDFNLQEALESLSEPESFPIQDELDVSQSSASEINAVLNSASSRFWHGVHAQMFWSNRQA